MIMVVAMAGGCAGPGEFAAQTYLVRPEDTLYSIAWRHDIDFKDLAAWNNLGPSLRIEPGQILVLSPPQTPQNPQAARPAPAAPRGAAPAAAQREIPQVEKPRPLPDSPARAQGMTGAAWVWPTRLPGRPVPVAGGGIMIAGALGQDILAAAAGKVVYVGSGLRGYGNLAIIKHSDSLLSAYAHNRELSVVEGQWVKSGERIGAMGLGPRQTPALYFEIRLNGRPVDVMYYLKSNFEKNHIIY
jgi:lipoprotein NlpD